MGGCDGLCCCSLCPAGEGRAHAWHQRLHPAPKHWEHLSPWLTQGHPVHPVSSEAGTQGWPCDAQRAEQEVFLPPPWHCQTPSLHPWVQKKDSQLKPGRRVTVGWSWRDSLRSWTAAGPGGGEGWEQERHCHEQTRLSSRLPYPDAARVCRPFRRPGTGCSCAHRGCGHGGVLKMALHWPCHHPAVNPVELLSLGVERSCASQTHPGAVPWQTTRQKNITGYPAKYRGAAEKSTESSQGWKIPSRLQPDPAPALAVVGAQLQQLPGVQALVLGQWLRPVAPSRAQSQGCGEKAGPGRGHGPCPGWGHSGTFLGSPPPAMCVCPGGRGAQWGALPGS